jgi:uncharacterized protein
MHGTRISAHDGNSTIMDVVPLQISIQIRDIAEARRFYREVIGCLECSSDEQWLNFNLHGHQIVCALNPNLGRRGKLGSHYSHRTQRFESDTRFPVLLEMEHWIALAERLRQQRAKFEVSPGEQATLLLLDPCGNAFEFKSSRVIAEQFLRHERRRAATWAACVVVALAILFSIVLQVRKPADELPVRLPDCAVQGLCAH